MKKARFIEKSFLILIFPVIVSCSSIDDWKQLDLGSFKISIPKNWKYQKIQGEDSFVGEIVGPNVTLYFDCSGMGYANSLMLSEEEYLGQLHYTLKMYPSSKPDTDYNISNSFILNLIKTSFASESKNSRLRHPPRKGDTLINFIKLKKEDHVKYSNADYIANIEFNGKSIHRLIYVPSEIKHHNIIIDTAGRYVKKTIWPKMAGHGMTGIYIYKQSSSFSFEMNGKNLSADDQQSVLKAFKTITFKE